MITRVKTYFVKDKPSQTDYEEAVEIAKKEDCMVELVWHWKGSGWFHQYLRNTDDAELFFKHVEPMPINGEKR